MSHKKTQLSDNFKIPLLVTYDGLEDIPTKNEPIFEFKDEMLDIGRLFFYLESLPTKERNKKIKKFRKMYPETNL